MHPVWVSRVWHFWSGVFSSCVRRGPLFPGDSDVLGLLTIVVFAGGVTDRVVRYRDQKPELLDCAERALGVALGVQAVRGGIETVSASQGAGGWHFSPFFE